MRRILRAASAAALLTSALLIPATAAQAAATTTGRLLPNPGFESGLAWWTADSGSATAISSPAHSGSGALQIADHLTTAGVSVRSARLAVVPGERLTASIWVKQAAAGAGGALYLEFWRADGSRTTPVSSRAAASSAAWQQLTVTGDVPDDAVTATELVYSSYADQGTTYWDDAAVSALPPPLRTVPNGGFEEQRDPATPTEWTVDGSGVSLVRGSAAYEGDTAVRIADGSTTASVSVLSKAVPVAVGETITASAWADPLSGSGATLYLEFRDSTGARLGATTAGPGSAGSGWQQVNVAATAPAGTTTVTVRLYNLEASVGTAVWDDVRLRSSSDAAYAPALGAGQQVLFAGDQRVESYSGVAHKVFPGTKANTDGIVLGAGTSAYNANPRCACTVLPGGPGEPAWKMWFAGSPVNNKGTSGYATSADGLTWTHVAQITGVDGVGGVVENPAWTSGSSVPRYYGISGRRSPDQYYFVQSTDGLAWTPAGSATLAGFDTENLTYDPIAKLFVAEIKRHLSIPLGPRTTWVSTSSDFQTWSPPRPSFTADGLDDELIPGAGKHGQTPWSEIYGMPAIRYGDQYLGTPWVFDITYSPNRDAGDNGQDKGRSHIELATSRDLVNWSRPSRDDLIVQGATTADGPAWDYGFQLSGTTFVTLQQPDGQWVTRFYYGAFAGEHSCAKGDIPHGDCDTTTGNSHVGLVSWPTDRFASFHGGGTVTTRPLTPAGTRLTVNYAPGTSGDTLKVEVLDVNGNVVAGYGPTDGTPITTDARAPGAQVTWGSNTTLPSGQIRLRFTQTGGDLYAFTVS